MTRSLPLFFFHSSAVVICYVTEMKTNKATGQVEKTVDGEASFAENNWRYETKQLRWDIVIIRWKRIFTLHFIRILRIFLNAGRAGW